MTDGNGLLAGQDNCRGVRQMDQKKRPTVWAHGVCSDWYGLF